MPLFPYAYGLLKLWMPMPKGSEVPMPMGSYACGFLCRLLPITIDYKVFTHCKTRRECNHGNTLQTLLILYSAKIAPNAEIAQTLESWVPLRMGSYTYGPLCLWAPMPMVSCACGVQLQEITDIATI